MADDRTAARYHRIQLALGIVSVTIDVAFLAVVAWSGGAHALAARAGRLSGAWWLELAIVAAALGAGAAALGAPLGWLRGYHLPRRYGLLHQPFAAWLGDRAKAAALGGVLGLAAVEAMYALMRATPLWWLVAAGIFSLASIALATIFPVWIVPLFYRLTPLADEQLRARLLALAARAGVPAVGVFVVDQSRKGRTANAALTGLGRTRRIVLFDTLVSSFSHDEIESVLAHELGHHVHRDLWRGLVAQSVVTLASFWVADRVLRASAGPLDLEHLADPAGLPWVALVIGAVSFVAVPLANALSRWMERRADDFALALTGNAGAFVGAMERLADLNLAERRPSRLKEMLLYSHPSIDRRIARARAVGSG
ncbi:MAG: M48 family metalloprotease [Candidatus Rokubacteria bacterium]|nr:M48 family metalloprotease [Candidatus Rokubacteria bacterium]